MYSNVTLAFKYLRYILTADNGKGHGVHSPFVFSFIENVLQNKSHPDYFSDIELYRKALLNNQQVIGVWDGGAGSRKNGSANRKVCDIAKTALKPFKYAKLLHDIVAYFKPHQIIELGTSLGVTTSYMSKVGDNHIYTLEGAPNIAAIARKHFESMSLLNITIIEGDFNNTLPSLIDTIESWDLAYIDGNHQYEPTMQYFNSLLACAHNQSFFIFDDIHWSHEMEQAWEDIKKHPQVTLTIDLFFIGLVFIRDENKIPMHYTIRY
jgi:predicted O-methyltransferase YrrM